MNILGISAFSHDSAACLLRDGRIVCALQEERFSRVKNDAAFPAEAFTGCLQVGGIDILDLDAIAYFEDPREKARRQLAQGVRPPQIPLHIAFDPQCPLRAVRRLTGFDGPIDVHPHHLCHAASAFHVCGHACAAVMVVDAVGEAATASFWHGHHGTLHPIAEVRFPQSLGWPTARSPASLVFGSTKTNTR